MALFIICNICSTVTTRHMCFPVRFAAAGPAKVFLGFTRVDIISRLMSAVGVCVREIEIDRWELMQASSLGSTYCPPLTTLLLTEGLAPTTQHSRDVCHSPNEGNSKSGWTGLIVMVPLGGKRAAHGSGWCSLWWLRCLEYQCSNSCLHLQQIKRQRQHTVVRITWLKLSKTKTQNQSLLSICLTIGTESRTIKSRCSFYFSPWQFLCFLLQVQTSPSLFQLRPRETGRREVEFPPWQSRTAYVTKWWCHLHSKNWMA